LKNAREDRENGKEKTGKGSSIYAILFPIHWSEAIPSIFNLQSSIEGAERLPQIFNLQ